MNSKEKNSILFLLRKWLSGDIRRAEEGQLDQLAADDPFVAEAMEGYRAFPEGDHARQVSQLKARLRKRYQKEERKGVFYLYRVAAAVAVLIIAVGGFWWLNQGAMQEASLAGQDSQVEKTTAITSSQEVNESSTAEKDFAEKEAITTADFAREKAEADDAEKNTVQKQPRNRIAAKEEKPPSKSEPTSNEPQIAAADDVKALEFAEETVKIEAAPELIEETPIVIPPEPTVLEQEEEGLAIEAEEADTPETAKPKALDQAIAGNTADRRQKEVVSERVPSQANAGPRTITGSVKDENGEALIGANILIPGSSTGTVTDFDGNFSLAVPEGAERITVNYTGYQSEEIEIGDQNNVAIILDNADIALDEVVVTGYGVAKKKDSEASYARPIDGHKKYKQYIEANLRYPKEAASQGIEGKVKLRFKVYRNGSIGNIEVVRSLGHGCDQEAIRLLQNGPGWELSGDKSPLTKTYVVRFDLP